MGAQISASLTGQSAATQTAKLRLGPKGVWVIAYSERLAAGQWRSRTVSTRKTNRAEAQAELSLFLKNEITLTKQEQADHQTIEQLCAFYVEHHASRKGETAVGSLQPIRERLGHLYPASLTPDVISAYRVARGVKDGTLRRELGALTAALNYCRGHNLITLQPKIDLPPPSPPRVTFMTDTQADAFWDAAVGWADQEERGPYVPGGPFKGSGRRLKLFVTLALDTGARAEAIMELTWDRVDLEKGFIDFRLPGRATSKKRRPVVPISDRLMPILEWGKAGQHPTSRVIGGLAMRKTWDTFVRSIDMEWVTPHVLRHTWATGRAHDGYSLLQIAQMLGDSVATVERNYVHFQPERLRDIANRTGRPF